MRENAAPLQHGLMGATVLASGEAGACAAALLPAPARLTWLLQLLPTSKAPAVVSLPVVLLSSAQEQALVLLPLLPFVAQIPRGVLLLRRRLLQAYAAAMKVLSSCWSRHRRRD